MSSVAPAFNFVEFARKIYEEKPHPRLRLQSIWCGPTTPLLLPAFYGGEAVQKYRVMFVFIKPLPTITGEQWGQRWRHQQCDTAEHAIQTHRHIFRKWAYSSNNKTRELFELFGLTSQGLRP